MNWYIAKIVFRITTESASKFFQFDEHLRLISALDSEEAILKARNLGLSEEDYFLNNEQQPVRWEFVNIAELIPLQEIKDGLEVYSQIKEIEEGDEYIRYVHQKAAYLQTTPSYVL